MRALFDALDGAAPVVIDLQGSSTHCPIALLGPTPLLKRVFQMLDYDELFGIVDAE